MITSRRIQITLLLSSFFYFAHSQAFDSLQTKVDTIVYEAIREKAFPGCVIYALKKDSVFFKKAYGYHTYDSVNTVMEDHIYDLASITKVTGATLALMKLYENRKFNLDDPIGDYVDGIGKKVSEVTFRECLAHQTGLEAWIPYYKEVKKKNGQFKRNTIGPKSRRFNYALSDSLYLHDDFYLKIKKMIRRSSVSKKKEYRYSGLFFYLVPEIVENLSGVSYLDYLNNHFFNPMNAQTLMFNPLEKFDLSSIVPTEIDNYFRMTPIHGTVHDEGAITMKGISGNAGLFGSASDLAKVWCMFLNGGSIDSISYLQPSTIQLFTTVQYPNNDNRRGLGFDKPLLAYSEAKSSVAKDASPESFGHTGFTGPIVWADPKHDFLFICLMNRVYPTRANKNLYKLNVRPRIHQVLYDFIKKAPTRQ